MQTFNCSKLHRDPGVLNARNHMLHSAISFHYLNKKLVAQSNLYINISTNFLLQRNILSLQPARLSARQGSPPSSSLPDAVRWPTFLMICTCLFVCLHVHLPAWSSVCRSVCAHASLLLPARSGWLSVTIYHRALCLHAYLLYDRHRVTILKSKTITYQLTLFLISSLLAPRDAKAFKAVCWEIQTEPFMDYEILGVNTPVQSSW